MFIGHYAAALAAKRVEPKLSLGTLVLAAMLADLLWPVFMIAGIEQVQFRHAMGAANYFAASNIAWSHSLLMDALWAAVLACAYAGLRRRIRGAWVLFGAGLSHWLLDWISHRPDLPLAPGTRERFGLGLWASIPTTIVVEGGMWVLAVILYARMTHAKGSMGMYAYWTGVAMLTLIWYNNVAGAPPRGPRSAGVAALILFALTIAWAYYVDRLRPAVIEFQHGSGS